MIVVRKKLVVEKGQQWLFEPDRYFFYITKDWTMPASEIVFCANDRGAVAWTPVVLRRDGNLKPGSGSPSPDGHRTDERR